MKRRRLSRFAPTKVITRTDGWEIVGFKYVPHLLVGLIALVVVYWAMGWELP